MLPDPAGPRTTRPVAGARARAWGKARRPALPADFGAHAVGELVRCLVRGKFAMIARWTGLVAYALFLAVTPGCLYYYTAYNVIHEPIYGAEILCGCCRDWCLAFSAYRAFDKEHPDHPCSADFAKGFRAGFRDYLAYGGTGAPPPMPPWCYWTTRYQFPEGRQAIQDWYEGYRQGTAFAIEAGYRNLITVPASVDRLRDPDLGVPPASLPGDSAWLPKPKASSTAPATDPAKASAPMVPTDTYKAPGTLPSP
jgi:hypothetical protein